MARSVKVTPQQRAMRERICAILTKAADDIAVEVEGTPMFNVQKADGSWAKKAMTGGQEFIFENAYVGKSGKIIFRFTPADTQVYEAAEVGEDRIDYDFPMFGPNLIEKLNPEYRIETEVMAKLISELSKRLALEDEKVREESVAQAETHPLYGRF